MIRRYTILLLIPHLGGGGAQRVIAQLARSLPCERFDVHLGVVTRSDLPGEKLPPCVRVHRINAHRVVFGVARLVRMVREIGPDLILSGMFHLNFLVLLLRPLFPLTTRILVRQNGMLSAGPRQNTRLERLLYRVTYPWAEGIVGQTSAMADEMKRILGSKARIHVLRNPVDVDNIRRLTERKTSQWADGGPHLLAVGRLSAEKGFDLLLEAFVTVRVEHPEARLVILGEGPERNLLESRCSALGLASWVRFAGYVSEPASWFADATLLVIPSRTEALPNVLLEGAAAGLPNVATPSSSGMCELIQGQAGIWLARDIASEALALSLKSALSTLRPGERFPHTWLEPFDLPEAIGKYEASILQTLAGVSG